MVRPDRETAIEAMRNMGWTAERLSGRKKPVWVFRRADTGGLYDCISRRQDELSMYWVAEMAMQYGDAPDLKAEISKTKEQWLRKRFLAIFTRAEQET